MVLLPYSTDAPLYHRPITTAFVMVVCVAAFIYSLANPYVIDDYALRYGNGLHPVQWVTSSFLHGDWMHLLGNLVAFGVFGMIVEGKLGWWKTFLLLSGIGIFQNAIEQTAMLWRADAFAMSLGLSAVIFAMIAMSAVWAPMNEIYCVWIWRFHRVHYFEFPVAGVGIFVVLMETLYAIFFTVGWSSHILHLMGAAIGAVVSVLMLRAGLVECENFDIFSVIRGRHEFDPDRAKKEADEKHEELAQGQRTTALSQIREQVSKGLPLIAWQTHQRVVHRDPSWRLPADDFLQLILAFHRKQMWRQSLPMMEQFIRENPASADPVRLRMAQILLTKEHRPSQALRILNETNRGHLTEKQQRLWEEVFATALRDRAKDPYEPIDD